MSKFEHRYGCFEQTVLDLLLSERTTPMQGDEDVQGLQMFANACHIACYETAIAFPS